MGLEIQNIDTEYTPRDGDCFPVRPSETLVKQFLDFVRSTNDPASFTALTTSPPKGDVQVELLEEFEISRKASKAPCSLCSPRTGKFFSGWLAWFPGDQKLRIIGNECGGKHLSAFHKAKKNFRARKQERAEQLTLESAILEVPQLEATVGQVLLYRRAIEPIIRAFHEKFGREAEKIAKELEKNDWKYTVEMEVSERHEGQSVSRWKKANIGRAEGQCLWIGYLEPSRAEEKMKELRIYKCGPEETPADVILRTGLKSNEYLKIAHKIRTALRMSKVDIDYTKNQLKFFSPKNFNGLNQWIRDASPLYFDTFYADITAFLHPNEYGGKFGVQVDEKIVPICKVALLPL